MFIESPRLIMRGFVVYSLSNMSNTPEYALEFDRLHKKVAETLTAFQEKNQPESGVRSRELSLAITKLQEAQFWLAEAERVTP